MHLVVPSCSQLLVAFSPTTLPLLQCTNLTRFNRIMKLVGILAPLLALSASSAEGAVSDYGPDIGGQEVPIPDDGAVAIEFPVPDQPDCYIVDADVIVIATHPRVSDLSFTMKHPGGANVGLMNQPPFTSWLQNTVLTFDDSSENNPQLIGGAPITPNPPALIPSQTAYSWATVTSQFPPGDKALEDLNNLKPGGTWVFKAEDHAVGSAGTIVGVTLVLDIECPDCVEEGGCGK